MELDDKTKNMIAQFQIYQQQLQSVLMQKESLKMQQIEIERSLEELNSTKQKNAYKITGSIMINKSVDDLKKELEESKETIDLRMKSLDKSEEKINNKLKELQTNLSGVVK